MPSPSRYSITLAKEDFKFSAAHFTVFGAGHAEVLHGHNYRVEVELCGDRLDELGFLLDLAEIKKQIRAACSALDTRTLVPEGNQHLRCREQEGVVELRFGAREYRLPREDVVLLPTVNTSIEILAEFLWERLAPSLRGSRVGILGVTVQETAGQRCRYQAPL